MQRNRVVKTRRSKQALPPSNLSPLNVVSFGFRVECIVNNKTAQDSHINIDVR